MFNEPVLKPGTPQLADCSGNGSGKKKRHHLMHICIKKLCLIGITRETTRRYCSSNGSANTSVPVDPYVYPSSFNYELRRHFK